MKQSNVAPLIDELGRIKAQIAHLEGIEKSIRDQIVKEMGVGAHEGELFRATVSEVEAERLDMEAVRAKLTPQFIRAHTLITKSVRVSVKARTGVALVAERKLA